MKKLLTFAMLVVFSISLVNAQTAKTKKDPAGDYVFNS